MRKVLSPVEQLLAELACASCGHSPVYMAELVSSVFFACYADVDGTLCLCRHFITPAQADLSLLREKPRS